MARTDQRCAGPALETGTLRNAYARKAAGQVAMDDDVAGARCSKSLPKIDASQVVTTRVARLAVTSGTPTAALQALQSMSAELDSVFATTCAGEFSANGGSKRRRQRSLAPQPFHAETMMAPL